MDAIVHKDGEGGPECTPHTNALPSDARLHVAVIAGQPRDVQTLLDAGCDPLFRYSLGELVELGIGFSYPPLSFYCEMWRIAPTPDLADPNPPACARDGISAIELAALVKRADVLALLVDALEKDGRLLRWHALFSLAVHGSWAAAPEAVQTLKVIFQHSIPGLITFCSVDRLCTGDFQHTASRVVSDLLLQHALERAVAGVDNSWYKVEHWDGALRLAILTGDTAMYEELQRQRAVNLRPPEGYSLIACDDLAYAAQYGQLSMVKYMLGCENVAVTLGAVTAAAQRCHVDMLDALLEHGPPPAPLWKETSPLWMIYATTTLLTPCRAFATVVQRLVAAGYRTDDSALHVVSAELRNVYTASLLSAWQPAHHAVFPRGMKEAVRTFLLCSQRHRRCGGVLQDLPAQALETTVGLCAFPLSAWF